MRNRPMTSSTGMSSVSDLERSISARDREIRDERRLAFIDPTTHLPRLAASLTRQSAMLGELGRREDALALGDEAVAIYRQLAEVRPAAFLPDLAMALNNQSNALGSLGRREDALAAIEQAVT